MATQRTLKLNLLADVDKFGKGLKQAGQDTQTFGNKVGKAAKFAGAALAAAGVAAAAYAVKIGVDGVKAAIEDEQSQILLAQALRNTTKATDAQIASTEEYITKQQLAFGVADTKLRPALANLARATSDVGKAQQLTNLALDISASTGKDLESVSLSLAKAYNGNIGALTKLGIPLDDAIKKSGNFNLVQGELTRLFGGAAKANTETYAGQLAIVTERFGELKESIGVGILPTLKTLLEQVNLVAKGFSGDDPDGLSARARELSGTVGGGGAFALGTSLRAVATAFTNLFAALNSPDADGSASALQKIANALETFASALNAVTTAYKKAQALGAAFSGSKIGGFILRGEELFNTPFNQRAAGGSVTAGQPYRVGEFGSEIFVPNGSGSIRPDRSNGGNTFIFNGVVDGESARRSIERLLQDSARRTGAVSLVGATL